MTETVHTVTHEFSSLHGLRTISVDAGTGSVTLACRHGAGNWIDVETFSADTVKTLDFGIARIYRFTVTGDATYAIG